MNDETALLHRAVEAAEHGVYVTDPSGKLKLANPAFCRITGYSREELLGSRMSILSSGRMSKEYYKRLWSQILEGHTWKEEILNRRKDGELYWAFQIISPVCDEDGTVAHFVGIQHDISETIHLREELTEALTELDSIFRNTQDAVFLVDVDASETFRYVKINPSHEELSGFQTESIRGKTPHQILRPDQARRVEENYRRCVRQRGTVAYEEELNLPKGTRTWHTQLTPVIRNERVVQIVGSARDITERKAMEEELRYLSEMDSLTGIANRRKITEELEREIARAARHEHPLSILIMDIDRFKKINDEFGHDTGDAVLRAISATTEAVLRPADRLGRWGGEEFVIILPETARPGAEALAERVLEAVRQCRAIPDYEITVSIGIASLRYGPDDHESIDALLSRADERMYRAKLDGRDRVYHPPAKPEGE